MEISGPFRHIGDVTLRYHHDFVEDGRPVWHYNQSSAEYDGDFDRSLTYTGPTGKYVDEHIWPEGSAEKSADMSMSSGSLGRDGLVQSP